MKLEYDAQADAAYLHLSADADQAKVAATVLGEDEAAGINLDLDANGRLIGVEILDAKTRLDPKLLTDA